MKGLRWWGFLVAMLAIGSFSNWRFFGPVAEGAAPQVTQIPHDFGPWHGKDVTLDDRSYEILETRNVLYREYRTLSDSPSMDLCIVFSPVNRKAPHPPEVCYVGTGAHVDKRPLESVSLISTSQSTPGCSLFVRHGRLKEVVLYWYLAGKELTNNYYAQQCKVMWAQLTGRPAQSAIIRYSTKLAKDESQEEAMARLKAFVQQTLPTILGELT